MYCMKQEKLLEGLAYAEQNYCNDEDTHLRYDKEIIKSEFNLNGKKVLDFGCGMGSMLLWYKSNWNCDIVGIDIDSNHLEVAREIANKFQIAGVKILERDILQEPLEEQFDFISLNDVVEHLNYSYLEKLLKELENTLSPGGELFISFPTWTGPYASHVNHLVGFPWSQFLPDFIIHKLIERNNKKLVGKLESDYLEVYKHLNRITYGKLARLIKKNTNLEIRMRRSHCFLNRISFLSSINFSIFPLNLFTTKEFVILKKPE